MEFRTDDVQMLGLWMAARLLGVIREVEGHRAQGELLTKAQILLTAFIVGLEPRHSDQVNVDPPRAGLGQVASYDA